MTNEERENILDQHKEVYDGYVTSYAQPEKNQPLYVQDMANDKQGLTVNNKGEVTAYKNTNINEMRFDNKSTGLFSEEEPKEQGHISPGGIYDTEESFESEDKDDEYYVSLGEQLDMIGDGPRDLDHGVFGDDDNESLDFDDEEDEFSFDDDSIMFNDTDDEDDSVMFDGFDDDDSEMFGGFDNDDSEMFDDIDDEEVEGLFDDLNESLDMFKRFTKYN
jgi:hypothetical protein